ncbi:hypothetical protein HY604_00355 [Candidatus Peregrinibacteria bacterium]|nr:hypothetical protein [Candidatus Peregrinibacteria bacterium]
MGTHGKTILTVLLVSIFAGGFYFMQSNNSALFKGQLDRNLGEENPDTGLLPDLKAGLEVLAASPDEDLKVSATISNAGQGPLNQGKPFKYAIYINGQEVFSNTDSYSSIAPGDSFNFVYPIPKTIYQYPNTGTVKFVVDTEKNISESSEENNEIETPYSF